MRAIGAICTHGAMGGKDLDSGTVLSQDAIDALLNSPPEADETTDASEMQDSTPVEEADGDPTVNVVEAPPLHPDSDLELDGEAELGEEVDMSIEGIADVAAVVPEQPAPSLGSSPVPPAPVYRPLPPPPAMVPPPVVAQPGRGGVTRDESVEIAGEAAETASAPIQAAVSRVSARVDTLEAALEQIVQLEEEISRLKKRPEPKPDPRIMQLFERMQKFEERARKSPVFGLYDKFTCSGCGHVGEAQVRVRCGHCEKDGWYGKKANKEAHAEHGEEAGEESSESGEKQGESEQGLVTDMLMALDPDLGI